MKQECLFIPMEMSPLYDCTLEVRKHEGIILITDKQSFTVYLLCTLTLVKYSPYVTWCWEIVVTNVGHLRRTEVTWDLEQPPSNNFERICPLNSTVTQNELERKRYSSYKIRIVLYLTNSLAPFSHVQRLLQSFSIPTPKSNIKSLRRDFSL